MNRYWTVCSVIAASLMLPACATITRGTSQKFGIETTPTEANVELSTGQTCVSPCQLELKRKAGFTVTARKAGYRNATAEVRSVVKGGGVAGAAGDVLIGAVIGGIVDGSNGSMKDLAPNPLRLTLLPEPAEGPVAEVAPTTEPAPVESPTGGQ